jgi:hypothetical protein
MTDRVVTVGDNYLLPAVVKVPAGQVTGTLADNQIPASIARDSEITTEVTAQVATRIAKVDGVVVVDHGTNASVARPTGYAMVIWRGSVQPTNALNTDFWLDTSS